MTQSNNIILKMVAENKTINEMCSLTGLTRKQVYRRLLMLENYGYNIKRKYYYSGDIVYSFNDLKESNNVRIIMPNNQEKFVAIVLSDLHIGSGLESLKALDMIYNYCAKEGITIIINSGDFIDGNSKLYRQNKKLYDLQKQIEYALKYHPFDENILNFVLFANHDIEPLRYEGIDIEKVVTNTRHDIVSLGYRIGKVNIKNDSITVFHPTPVVNQKSDPLSNGSKIVLYGHTHDLKYTSYPNKVLVISVPSLSNVHINNDVKIPKAIKMTLNFKNEMVTSAIFEDLLVHDKIYKIGEHVTYFNNNESMKLKPKKRRRKK